MKIKEINCFDGEFAFLSNFFPSKIIKNQMIWPTVEHLFQSRKTNNFDERIKILTASTPGKAKRLGKKVMLRNDWEDVKVNEMLLCIRLKFNHDPFKKMLLDTGDAILVEGNNWHDNFWGNCTCSKCSKIWGQNTLGRILMHVRKELKNA